MGAFVPSAIVRRDGGPVPNPRYGREDVLFVWGFSASNGRAVQQRGRSLDHSALREQSYRNEARKRLATKRAASAATASWTAATRVIGRWE